jgi:putative transposase
MWLSWQNGLYNAEMPIRQHLQRLPNVWIKCPLYFVTVCTAGRRRLLNQPAVVDIVVTAWRSAQGIHGWAVGRYVIMPDHVHFFTASHGGTKSLSDFMRDWKKWTARSIVAEKISSAPIWQAEFFEHLLRSAESYAEKWEHVRQNPVRAGLVTHANEWLHQGECEPLPF